MTLLRVAIFELRRFGSDDRNDPLVAPFEQALAAYRAQGFEIAEAGFRKSLDVDPEDGASAIFLERLGGLREHPPGRQWDGVWTLSSK